MDHVIIGDNAPTTTQHPFSRSGFCDAPFTFMGHTHNVGPHKLPGGVLVGSPGQPMGCCAHCGQGIANEYRIKSACGKVSTVGCVCIEKLYKEYKYTTDPVLIAVRKAKAKDAAAKRKIHQQKMLAEFTVFCATHKLALCGTKMANGHNAWESVVWFGNNAGVQGAIKLYKELNKMVCQYTQTEYKACEVRGKANIKKHEATCAASRAEIARVDAIPMVDVTWLVQVLERYATGNFVREMVACLNTPSRHAIADRFTPRQLEVMCDVYGKYHGRRNSGEYNIATARFQDAIK